MPVSAYFSPYWPSNPYQPMLVNQLTRAGVSVVTDQSLKSLVRSGETSHSKVLHVHWLPVADYQVKSFANWLLFSFRIRSLKRRGWALVWTAHNVIPHESKFPTLDRWLSRSVATLADRIICHSPSAREELRNRLALARTEKIRIIPHGNYIECYPNTLEPAGCRQKLGLPADATVFLSLGIIRPYKGVMELIGAFQKVTDPSARLVIAGKPYNPETDAIVRSRIAIDPRIRYFPGYVADQDLQLYLNAANAVVFPYRKSLTSGALILAMSFGRACIAPRLPGMADCLAEEGGIFYEPDDNHGLESALTEAGKRKTQLEDMGAKNLLRAREWDWSGVAGATHACYQEAIAASVKSRPAYANS